METMLNTDLNDIHDNDPKTAEATSPMIYKTIEMFSAWKTNNNGGAIMNNHQRTSDEFMAKSFLLRGTLSILYSCLKFVNSNICDEQFNLINRFFFQHWWICLIQPAQGIHNHFQ